MINEKWFEVIKFIEKKDLDKLLKKNFLDFLDKIWISLFPILILSSLFLVIFLNNDNIFNYTLVWWFVFSIFIFFWVFINSIIKSYFLIKNIFIIKTQTHTIINSKIFNINDEEKIQKEIKKIEKIFELEFFKENQEINMIKEYLKNFVNWFEKIYKKNLWSLLPFMLFAYSVYHFFMSIIFFIWIWLISFISIFINKINKYFLIKLWDKIANIENLFIKIEDIWNSLKNESIKLTQELVENENISTNLWENINKNLNLRIEKKDKLKLEIMTSKYKNIYNFDNINFFIKNQIFIPLDELINILIKNQKIIEENITKIEKQITETKQILKQPLILTKDRLFLQKNNYYDKISVLKNYQNIIINS